VELQTLSAGASISLSPDKGAIIVNKGNSGTITLTMANSLDEQVDMELYISGGSTNHEQPLPAGITAEVDPSSFAVPADGTTSSTLTLTVDSTATSGIYPLYPWVPYRHYCILLKVP
jgi:hypothetical protein